MSSLRALARRARTHLESMRHDFERIEQIAYEARILVEELRRRRDGCTPRKVDVPNLAEAVREVARHA